MRRELNHRLCLRAALSRATAWTLILGFCVVSSVASEPANASKELLEALNRHKDFASPLQGFLRQHCFDCHGDGASEGDLDFESLEADLSDAASFARWERVFDRVRTNEMPPPDSEQPTKLQRSDFRRMLARPLHDVHSAKKSTVLRRLNRREYQNTLNDTFGTHLDLADTLPEDARSHEFDNVGEALGLSMVHMERYLSAAKRVLDAAIVNEIERPAPTTVTAWYKDQREAKQHVGKVWKLLDNGFVVRFAGGGYPSGMLRGSGVRRAGRYRVRIDAYAYQSDHPIAFSVGGTSFAKGSDKPLYAFFSAPPGESQTFEFETWIEPNYMLEMEPYGISDPKRYQRQSVETYSGPGLAIGEVTLEGPLTDEYPSRGHQLIFDGLVREEIPPGNPRDRAKPWYRPTFRIRTDDPLAAAGTSIRRVAEALFRRPVEEASVAPFVALFENRKQAGDTTEEALRASITALLCSPRFLFLHEPPGTLDDHALASRLSYFLHRTTPDGILLAAARRGELKRRETLMAFTMDMMKDDRFSRFLVDFADSWLDLREIDFTAPDRKLYPEYDLYLRDSMPKETLAYLREMIESNLPIRNLVQSDFAMLNGRLAQHYDLPPVEGTEIRRVPLPEDSIRGGLLAQASILKVTANGTNTSPVTRGVWVMERLEGVTPPPPPPGVPGVEPDIRGATTLRQLLDLHRDADNCRACHQKIDPPGFALECFNPIGGFRDRYRSLGKGDRVETEVNGRRVSYRLGPPVDNSGELPGGDVFDNYFGYRRALAEREHTLARTFLTKLLTFATGREMGFSDRPEINRIVTAAESGGYRTGDLIRAAVGSEIFRTK